MISVHRGHHFILSQLESFARSGSVEHSHSCCPTFQEKSGGFILIYSLIHTISELLIIGLRIVFCWTLQFQKQPGYASSTSIVSLIYFCLIPIPGVWVCQLQHWYGARCKWMVDRWMDENEKAKHIPCQVVWRVILPPGEEFWRVGSDAGVRLQHVTTGKFLTVTRW